MARDDAYKQAEQKIQQALQSGATELDLRSMKLTELPESIGQLKQLRKLDLGGDSWKDEKNQLTTLPPSLGQLTQLTELNLSSNQLTTLPPSLGQLTQLTSLDLSSNQLTTLPDWLGQLTQLTSLNLSSNKLTTLPDSLGQLTQLTELNLSNNKLTTLPDSLGQLTQLQTLNLSNNQLTALPDSLGQLTQMENLDLTDSHLTTLPEFIGKLKSLQELWLHTNQLTSLPNSISELVNLKKLLMDNNEFLSLPVAISQLTSLTSLYASVNKLTELPIWIGNLRNLRDLTLRENQLDSIPVEIGNLTRLEEIRLQGNQIISIPMSLARLEHLKLLFLDDNPLNPALQSAYNACKGGNYEPLFAYLRSLEQNAEPLYEAKLVLVGEGNVGKTTLLKALKGKAGEAPQEHEPTTHGVEIDIHGLRLPHPAQNGVEIQLNAWDFGGQDVYRVTHQFFFSRRSLYLLVWEPRRGVQQGQVEDWLNMIRLRVGDDARVIIVSTHCKTGERIARIDQPVFKQQYGDMIVGFHEVDSLVPDPATGEMAGIAELKKVIAEHASKLEQMGMGFNRDWKAARDELLARLEPRISFDAFSGVCAARGLSGIDTETLAHLMHDLGYIVHYSDDEKLRDDVILKPEWLTKAIGFVLEDRATAESEGILPDKHLYEVWHDHHFKDEPRYTPDLYPFFLRLMEKYDVSYRLPDDRHASLVAQHVPQVRPDLPWLPEQEPPANLRRIAMICAMEEDPPGLVPWMIVRTHDYSVAQGNHHLHWQKGVFLRHAPHGEALLEKREREFHIYAQAAWPEHFMNVLHSTLEKLIADNWPGLKDRYRFMVPCPEIINGQPCKGRFPIHTLRQWLAEGDTIARCHDCSKRQSIAELLFGFEERSAETQLIQLMELKDQVSQVTDQITQAQGQISELNSRIADYFWATMHAIADEGKNGPRLFTFQQRGADPSLKQLFTRPLELQLWCEAEGCQHPVYDYGIYPIDQTRDWVATLAPYANFVLGVLKAVSPIAAPAINVAFGAKTTETWGIKDKLDLTKAILDKLPTVKVEHRSAKPGDVLTEPERSGILALHRFLNELDPTQAKLGLHRVATYTGDYRWLCKHHYEAWQPNIPDVIDSRG
ncbi:MAG: leucine-rich repeat domain-containing protein [Chloroflexota bacterium]